MVFWAYAHNNNIDAIRASQLLSRWEVSLLSESGATSRLEWRFDQQGLGGAS
jgi:hypothetical protein